MQYDFAAGEILLINKPLDWTSFDVVKKVRNTIRVKKVGHAGTLDPLATGLLILCTGKFTKRIDEIQGQEKEYTGIIRLGEFTPSYDRETEVTETRDCSHLTEEEITAAAQTFVGTIEQVPPIYSAVQVDGKRAYDLARKGKEVELKARTITIQAFDITSINGPEVAFKVICSKGTYIRSLAHDLGQKLGVGGHLSKLERTRIGAFKLEDALTIEDIVEIRRKQLEEAMKVIRDIAEFPQLSYAVVTSGTFDGVHVGHQKILRRVMERARQSGGQSVVITFWPHPRLVLFPEDNDLKLLSTIEERIEHLREFGIDYLLIIPFTKEFSRTTSRSFITDILVRAINTKVLIIGYDHRFGKNREGSFEHLKARSAQYGFEVEEIPREDVDDIGVSSTKIRRALESGDIDTANRYLGRLYSVTSEVEEGQKLGRTIGFPTANLALPPAHKLIPGNGVYAVWATVEEARYPAMMNIGVRPTVDGKRLTLEVHLLQYNGNLYGKTVTVEFVEQLRKERKFDNLEALQQQLQQDKEATEQLLQA